MLHTSQDASNHQDCISIAFFYMPINLYVSTATGRGNNPFHKGIPNIQTTDQFTISWNLQVVGY